MRVSFVFYFTFLFCINSYATNFPAMQATRVADNVYAILTPARDIPNPQNKGWNSNSAFVVTETGVLVFDTGSSLAIGNALKNTIQQVTSKPVKWIINSHAHGDHWLGNIAFADSGPQIFSTTKAQEIIEKEGLSWVNRFKRLTHGITGDTRVVAPDHVVDSRTEIMLDKTRLVLFPSGNSHSPGDLIAWLPDLRVLISGDVVYSDRMPSTNASSLFQWIRMLQQLEQLQPDKVIPGHGKITDINGLIRLRQLLSGIRNEVQKGYDEGLTDFEMTPQVIKSLQGFEKYYPGFKKKLARDISHVYLQIEAAAFQ